MRGCEAPRHIQYDNSRSHKLKHAVLFSEICQSSYCMNFWIPLLELCACVSGLCCRLFGDRGGSTYFGIIGNTAHIRIRKDSCAESTSTTYYRQESLKSVIVFTVLFSYALLKSHQSQFNYHFSNMRRVI
jgi:hypothetical protein